MGRSLRNKRLFGEEDPENVKSKVSRKISKFVEEEDMSQDQAVAVALDMKRRGDL